MVNDSDPHPQRHQAWGSPEKILPLGNEPAYSSTPTDPMSTEPIYCGVLRPASAAASAKSLETHLDIGSGQGRLIDLLSEKFGLTSSAIDYTDELMKRESQKVDIANLNTESLLYEADSFDIVTATEVIEHLEHYREVLREIHRVTRPGGSCILTTPNILNLNSRIRFFNLGF